MAIELAFNPCMLYKVLEVPSAPSVPEVQAVSLGIDEDNYEDNSFISFLIIVLFTQLYNKCCLQCDVSITNNF